MSDPRTFSWHKRPGWVLASVEWRAGVIVRRMWKPPASRAERAAERSEAVREPVKRGALAAEQRSLDL